MGMFIRRIPEDPSNNLISFKVLRGNVAVTPPPLSPQPHSTKALIHRIFEAESWDGEEKVLPSNSDKLRTVKDQITAEDICVHCH